MKYHYFKWGCTILDNYVFIHGSGHKACSWNKTISFMSAKNILIPELSELLNGKAANYENLYNSFCEYCNVFDGQIHLCGLSLGGILALNYAIDFPDKIKSLVLIGAPHKIPKILFAIQNIIFKFLPKKVFNNMAFDKKNTFDLSNSMKKLNFFEKSKEIKCKTLIICGKKDRANMKSAHYFSKNIRNSKIKIIENVGHIVNEEAPQELAHQLEEFYKELL